MKDKAAFILYDDEPNPFAMSEEEYEKARDEYTKKAEAEEKKLDRFLSQAKNMQNIQNKCLTE
jgi:hypothetical protein